MTSHPLEHHNARAARDAAPRAMFKRAPRASTFRVRSAPSGSGAWRSRAVEAHRSVAQQQSARRRAGDAGAIPAERPQLQPTPGETQTLNALRATEGGWWFSDIRE